MRHTTANPPTVYYLAGRAQGLGIAARVESGLVVIGGEWRTASNAQAYLDGWEAGVEKAITARGRDGDSPDSRVA